MQGITCIIDLFSLFAYSDIAKAYFCIECLVLVLGCGVIVGCGVAVNFDVPQIHGEAGVVWYGDGYAAVGLLCIEGQGAGRLANIVSR
jgi:hypothetical protein